MVYSPVRASSPHADVETRGFGRARPGWRGIYPFTAQLSRWAASRPAAMVKVFDAASGFEPRDAAANLFHHCHN
jgi:hypothetical protein